MTRGVGSIVGDGRTLPVRMRADLVIAPRPTRHGQWWTVKDPLSLQYYQLRDEELFVLVHLDGRTSASTILSKFKRRFAPCRLAFEELIAFIHRLAAQGLVTTSPTATAPQPSADRRRRARRERWMRLPNPLALQWRGFDPQPLLDRFYPFVRWLFSPWSLGAGLGVVVAAVVLIVSRWEQFRMQLPAASAVLAPGNLVLVATAIAVVKVLHELGHALTCRHLGGECHELGLMLLAFVPCMYCDVSDAWLFSSKWRRIAVSAAGICVELVLAAVCAFLWWYSEPGPFHSLCQSVMIVTSVGTLLLNGNPLLRYDGYYVLSDLLEVPNLRRRSVAACRLYCAEWLFGIAEPDDDPFDGPWRGPLALYGAASLLYSWVVLFVILRFVDGALEPHGLRPLAGALAVLVVGGRLAGASIAATRRIAAWNETGLLRPFRFGCGCAAIAAAAAVVLLLPLPHRVAAPFVVAPRDARPIYVTVPGKLATGNGAPGVRYGDRLTAGQIVAVLESHELDREIVRLEGEYQRQKIVVELLRRQQVAAEAAAARLSSARAVVTDLDHQLQQRIGDRGALTLKSPRDGILLPPAAEATPRADQFNREGRPLDPRNEQSYLEQGTLVGVVGIPGRYDALLVVDQVDIAYVRPGQSVRLQLPELGAAVVTGAVVEVATERLQHSPPPLVATGRLPSRIGDDGTVQPLRTGYEVRVELTGTPETLTVDAAGASRIDVGRMTLARRLRRWLEATFARDR